MKIKSHVNLYLSFIVILMKNVLLLQEIVRQSQSKHKLPLSSNGLQPICLVKTTHSYYSVPINNHTNNSYIF